MIVARDPLTPPLGLQGCVVAIGNFDGVHRGHAAVIRHAKALAEKLGQPCVALTFEPHPVDFFSGTGTIFRLTPEAEKVRGLARQGLDGTIIISFDGAVATMEAEDFVKDILIKRLGISGAVVGYDFHFGKARSGSPSFLKDAGARHGFAVEVVEKVVADVDGASEAVHSNAARKALEEGDVQRAAAILGHEWFAVGEVVHGEKLGRQLGFPTANVRLDPSCRLRHGIYAVRLSVEGITYGGVANFGRRPTVTDTGAPLLETFVFDFSGDLYGKTVEVAFVGWIRGEEKFPSLEALVAEMNRDKEKARKILRGR
jgi:riboflavin kinase/FMN adenylyltransferase